MSEVTRTKDGIAFGPNFLSKKLWSALRSLPHGDRRRLYEQALANDLPTKMEAVYRNTSSDARNVTRQSLTLGASQIEAVDRQTLKDYELSVQSGLYGQVWEELSALATKYKIPMAKRLASYNDSVFVEQINGVELNEVFSVPGKRRNELRQILDDKHDFFIEEANQRIMRLMEKNEGVLDEKVGNKYYFVFPGEKRRLRFQLDLHEHNFKVVGLTKAEIQKGLKGPEALDFFEDMIENNIVAFDPFVLVWEREKP